MKTRTLITFTLLGIVLGFMVFYFSTYVPSYNEGMGLMYSDDPEMYAPFLDKYPVYQMQETDYDDVPKIKYMMDVLLTVENNGDHEYVIHQDSTNEKYEVRITPNEYNIRVGMSPSELDHYNKWVEDKSTNLYKYEDAVFLILNWDKIN
ncbi:MULTISPECIES: hypothetical protein [Nitrosopumilus]|nr:MULTISPECIES: hypothetical protein [Nitrosopumilus]